MIRRAAFRLMLALALALVAGVVPDRRAEAGNVPPEAFMTVEFEAPEGGAFAQEMVIMHVRSFFKVRATLERLEQPSLDSLGWIQLGRDQWAPTVVNRENYFGFERRIALFAPDDGSFAIPPFIHHVTLIDADGRRWNLDVTSKPAQLTIRPWRAGPGGPDDPDHWWLPARSVEVTDHWAGDPSTLGAGESMRRTVEVRAVGVPGEQLPPQIPTNSRGVIAFPGAVERRTEVVEGLPVGHAVYSYDVRPHTGSAAILREAVIPWFDTKARAMRQAIVPGVSVGRGMVVPGQPRDGTEADAAALWQRLVTAGTAAAAFVVGLLALLWPGRRERIPILARLWQSMHRRRALRPLRAAARRGDGNGFRAGVYALARADGAAGALWMGEPRVAAGLAALDRALFAGAAAPAGEQAAAAATLRALLQTLATSRARVLPRMRREAVRPLRQPWPSVRALTETSAFFRRSPPRHDAAAVLPGRKP